MNLKRILFKAKLRYFLNKKDRLKVLKSIDTFTTQELKNLNFQKRKEIVNYAYINIPF